MGQELCYTLKIVLKLKLTRDAFLLLKSLTCRKVPQIGHLLYPSEEPQLPKALNQTSNVTNIQTQWYTQYKNAVYCKSFLKHIPPD